MATVVLKIKYGQSLRRLVVPTGTGSQALTFAQLEAKIRELFAIAPSSKLLITYADEDGDSVTLAEDQELHDACFVQNLNPLRLFVSVEQESSQGSIPEAVRKSFEGMSEMQPAFEAVFKALEGSAPVMMKALEPMMKEGFSEFMQAFPKPPSGDHRPKPSDPPAAAAKAAPPAPEMKSGVHHFNVA